ncbi:MULTISPECIES: hypothetical protein [unclassified Flavobacterium]|jgi:hypothetical protein|uniref:hypothetical protein n=1 Tax=unclassified Flavobacterium TaxID=196869 RepID=UPI0025B7E4BD|nr:MULTISPECIES: hypothetical protein [unclassified Flavobacterium]
MTKENKKKIDNARLKYKPDRVKTLLIAEAPPDSLERFFYYENVRERDYLFLGVTEALYPNLKEEFIASGRTPEKKSIILNKLKKEGYFLIDLSDTPISLLNDIPVETFVPNLIEKVKKVADTNTNIILIKANVYDLAYKELAKLGYKVVDIRIPFPSSGQQTNFQRTFRQALTLTNRK